MIISFLFTLWDCYMGPIWDPSGQPADGLTHMGPMRNPVALPIWDPYRHVCWEAGSVRTSKIDLLKSVG